ncbi:MAG: hypothetical protein ACM3MH_03280 [Actinomycetota bacterium]
MDRSSPRLRVALVLLTAALAIPSCPAHSEDGLGPGEAFVTRFSGAMNNAGKPAIDLNGTVGSILDLRHPGTAPDGAQWLHAPQRSPVTAGQVGEVFGVTLDDATPPNVYVTATSAFGLHRNDGNTDWMEGLWGPGGGPGSVWKLDGANGNKPSIFADIKLDGRVNSGAALGNIAFDRWNKQFFVSDLETGMIHRLRLSDGKDLGHYDHGTTARVSFFDATADANAALPAVAFDPATSVHIKDCPSGDFARTPSCWNFADFRRRVWGLGLRRDPASSEIRLYYAIWGSQGFGNPDYAAAGDDQRNSVWSVRIGQDGDFDTTSMRREFLLPDFFRSPEAILRAGRSNPVTDIAFPEVSQEPVMVLAERGGVRNLGLAAENAFATPHEARVLRYQLNDKGVWEPIGRYDIGFYDRKDEGPPYIRADSSGGAAFGLGYTASWEASPTAPDAFLWMTGDALCWSKGPCLDPAAKTHTDQTEVHGVTGRDASAYQEIVPDAAFQPYPAPGPAYPADGPDRSYLIDIDAAQTAPAPNDATRIGDIAIYEAEAKKPDLKITKKALPDRCTAGSPCTFELLIENIGGAPYQGALVIRDVADGTAKLLDHAPADWTCKTFFAGSVDCSHAEVSLAPGENISVALTVEAPSWWTKPVYSNCAEITTPGFGEDDKAYNNKACDYVPTVEPAPYGPDLEVQKFWVDPQCDWVSDCYFVVRVINVGPAPYSGPLHVHDKVDQPGAIFIDWSRKPEWACAPVGAGNEFDCTHPTVALTPGDYVDLFLVIQAPPIAAGHTHVRNCSWLDWDGLPRDYNPGNEYACATVSRFPPGFPGAVPELDINKKAAPACWRPAPGADWGCEFLVTITNIGGATYFDPIELNDLASNVPATLTAYALTPPWTCVDGGGGNVTCEYPALPGGLPPGASIQLDMVFTVPGAVAVPNWLQNCGMILWDSDGDGVAEEHQSCAISIVCDAGSANCWHDLALLKFVSSDPCFVGGTCDFLIEVMNLADVASTGPTVITDIPDIGLGPPIVAPPGWACAPAGGSYSCTNPLGIAPGGVALLSLSFPVPAGYALPTVKNCAQIEAGPPDNTITVNDKDCATGSVPFPDLAPGGATECRRGESCTIDARIDNKGRLPFHGAAGLHGTLAPAVKISSIKTSTPGFACSVTGNGIYDCKGSNLELAPGTSLPIELVIDIPADFKPDAITHTKEMVWPDRAVEDKNPKNDKQTSTITILGPQQPMPPTCTGGTVKNGECVCPKDYTPQQTGTNAFTCVKKPPEISCKNGSVKNGECVCAGGYYPKQTGTNSFICVKATPEITCKDGRIVDNECVCPTGSYPKQIGDNAFICAKKPTEITCRGGTVQDNECVCPEGWYPKKIAKNVYACVQKPPEITCTGGTVQNGQCTCPAGTVVKKTGKNAYACVPILVCRGGTVQNNECVCPEGSSPKQISTNNYSCVSNLVCVGGKVKNNECVCPRGSTPKQTGPYAYQCVASLICRGGSVQNNECVCPEGSSSKKTGENAYLCVPNLTCTGGQVKNNECVCPSRTHAEKSGPDSYRCVANLTCRGGTVQNNECVCPEGSTATQVNDKVYYCKTNITCINGRVKDGKCVCLRGLTLTQTGPNAFACIKAPTGGATQGSTGGTSGGSTGAPTEGQTGVHVPNFKVPPSGVLVPR